MENKKLKKDNEWNREREKEKKKKEKGRKGSYRKRQLKTANRKIQSKLEEE